MTVGKFASWFDLTLRWVRASTGCFFGQLTLDVTMRHENRQSCTGSIETWQQGRGLKWETTPIICMLHVIVEYTITIVLSIYINTWNIPAWLSRNVYTTNKALDIMYHSIKVNSHFEIWSWHSAKKISIFSTQPPLSHKHFSWRSSHFLNATANFSMGIPFVACSQAPRTDLAQIEMPASSDFKIG